MQKKLKFEREKQLMPTNLTEQITNVTDRMTPKKLLKPPIYGKTNNDK